LIGLVLALVSGFFYVSSTVFVRRGLHNSGESYSPVPIALFFGTVLIGISVLITGGFEQLSSLSWMGMWTLVGAGVIHFILGRMLGYIGIRLIGANRSVPISTSTVLMAVLLGVLILGEPMTFTLALAILFISGGVTLISTTRESKAEAANIPAGSMLKGVLVSLAAALCWGITPTLIKIGLRDIDSPLLGAFISYASSSVLIAISLLYPGNSEKLRRLSRASLVPFIIAAFATSAAQIFRYIAFGFSPVSLVAPLIWANSLFVFPLSFLINRRIEAFSMRAVIGAIAMVIGIFLIFWVA
jgi:drug/metabolite transporter (DMT)-like permease